MSVANEGTYTRVSVEGRLDAVTSKEFEDRVMQVIDSGEKYLLFDFTSVDYISSAGLRALLTAKKKLGGSGGKIVLAGLKKQVQEVLEIAGFTPLFVITASTEEGRNQF